MPDDRVTIGSTARLHPDEVARRTFATTRRGFDPGEVRSFLELVAREMAATAEREQDMRRAVKEAEHRAANPVLDEPTLTAALGQETARVLRSAHDAAAELMARADGDALRVRTQAQEEAEALQRRTEQVAAERSAQAEATAAELRRRAQEESTGRTESAKLEADAVLGQARAECRAMVQEAQELRARVLADLARRRRVLHSQIEQLRAGRERLAETIGDVRTAVDSIADELFRAEDEARLAAEAAGRQVAQEEMVELASAEALREEVGDAGEGDSEAQRRQSVEDLFARLRAGPQAAPAPSDSEPAAPTAVGGPEMVDATATAPAAPRATGPKGGARRGGAAAGGGGRASAAEAAEQAQPTARTDSPASVPAPAPEPASPSAAQSAAATAAATVPTAETPVVGADVDPEVARRDEALAPVVSALARRLKRALQDDQNDILDRLRAKGGWAPGVLPSEEEHAQRYVVAASEQLMEAARAGAVFAGATPEDTPDVVDIASDLASGIVAPLRRRLESEGPSVESGDEPALVELVGAAYREWKGARTERLAQDESVYAFARAAVRAVPPGTALRWVVDDGAAECPDCDDNALAGPVTAGDAYPTGHPHPPAHAGCRCLLAPATA